MNAVLCINYKYYSNCSSEKNNFLLHSVILWVNIDTGKTNGKHCVEKSKLSVGDKRKNDGGSALIS